MKRKEIGKRNENKNRNRNSFVLKKKKKKERNGVLKIQNFRKRSLAWNWSMSDSSIFSRISKSLLTIKRKKTLNGKWFEKV